MLFVSEKAAALEVVRNRLAHVGLESYVLELHSHKASRKEVAAQLASALDSVPVPPTPMSSRDRARAAAKREQLGDYAGAMNERRRGLDTNLHLVHRSCGRTRALPARTHPKAAWRCFDRGPARVHRRRSCPAPEVLATRARRAAASCGVA